MDMVINGGQGRNRTIDTRIFRRFCRGILKSIVVSNQHLSAPAILPNKVSHGLIRSHKASDWYKSATRLFSVASIEAHAMLGVTTVFRGEFRRYSGVAVTRHQGAHTPSCAAHGN
jgi:hypothetical protein